MTHMALTFLLILSSGAAQSGSTGSQAAELWAVFTESQQAEHGGEWDTFVDLMHPEMIDTLRTFYLSLLGPDPSGVESRRTWGVASRHEVEQLDPVEAVRRPFHQGGDGAPRWHHEEYPNSDFAPIGVVYEGALAHVLFRYWFDRTVPSLSMVRVVSLKRAEDAWRRLPSPEYMEYLRNHTCLELPTLPACAADVDAPAQQSDELARLLARNLRYHGSSDWESSFGLLHDDAVAELNRFYRRIVAADSTGRAAKALLGEDNVQRASELAPKEFARRAYSAQRAHSYELVERSFANHRVVVLGLVREEDTVHVAYRICMTDASKTSDVNVASMSRQSGEWRLLLSPRYGRLLSTSIESLRDPAPLDASKE